MKTIAILLVFLYSATAATPPEIESVIKAARSVPGEFASDALIRLAALPALDRERRIALLEEAFQRAGEAQKPLKRIAALVRLPGPVGFENKVYSQDLDTLSLRLRAVEGMQAIDGVKARELFGRIRDLRILPVTCEDYQVYDVERFYEVLEKLIGSADTAERLSLLQRHAASVTSAVQIAGMARVLTAADVSDDGFRTLVESFAKALAKVSGDDRSFTWSRNAGKQIEALTAACKRRKISPLPLLESYRVYLVFNLTAPRCADNDLMLGGGLKAFAIPGEVDEAEAADFVGFFNTKLRMTPLLPITEVEATPSRLEGAATGLRTCQDTECTKLTESFRSLVLGSDGSPVPLAKRNTPEWEKQFATVLDAVGAWKPSVKSAPAEFFRDKAGAYTELLNLAPPGAGRDRVVAAMVAFLAANSFQKTNRAEWFLPVNGLIGRIGIDPLGFGRFSEELRKSGDPVIALYAALEPLAPRPPDRILRLL